MNSVVCDEYDNPPEPSNEDKQTDKKGKSQKIHCLIGEKVKMLKN